MSSRSATRDEPGHHQAERGGAEHRRVHLGRVARGLAPVLDDRGGRCRRAGRSRSRRPRRRPPPPTRRAGTPAPSYGTAAGKRSFRSVWPPAGGVAVHQLERRSPTSTRARAACRRRSGRRRGTHRAATPTATAAHPSRTGGACRPSSTTSGASAISGTVCDTTRYGSSPRRTTSKRAISTASATPTTAPSAKPDRARRNEYHAPRSTTTPDRRVRRRGSRGRTAARPSSTRAASRGPSSWAGSASRTPRRPPRARPLVELPQRGHQRRARATNRMILRIDVASPGPCVRDGTCHCFARARSAIAGMTCSP